MNKGWRFYPRHISSLIHESSHAVNLELNYLHNNHVLNRVKEGGHFFYHWNELYPFSSLLQSVILKMRDLADPEMLKIPCLEQTKRIHENLSRVVGEIKKYYNPDKIILFGSAAAENIGPDSDIDLVVIKETSLPFFKRTQQLVDLLHYDIDIDFLVYTPKEFTQALQQKNFFREEIIRKGKVLYDKAA